MLISYVDQVKLMLQIAVKQEFITEMITFMEENKRFCETCEEGSVAFHVARRENTFYVQETCAYAR